jgi:putative SOS response-associated peptidase YedK
MCGRYTLVETPSELYAELDIAAAPAYAPRYNIAPTQHVPVIVQEESRREVRLLRWGLVPFWAADSSGAARMINARAETVATKPAFRAAFRRRRCALPADGFYEWRRDGRARTPFRFRDPSGKPFLMAGLWERWCPADAEAVESVAVITVDACDVVRAVHDRMPALLDVASARRWLDDATDLPAAAALLRPWPDLEAAEVSSVVNSPRYDGPECIVPV